MVKPFRGMQPVVAPDAYVAPTALIIGDVEIGSRSSVWFGTVVRGDVHRIRIGRATNVQDASALHVTRGTHPLVIGDEVTIGHRAVIHGCTIGNRVLIAMGALVLDGAVIGDESVVGAGAVVPEGAVFPPRSVILGVPARKVRDVTEKELQRILVGRDEYIELSRLYLQEEWGGPESTAKFSLTGPSGLPNGGIQPLESTENAHVLLRSGALPISGSIGNRVVRHWSP